MKYLLLFTSFISQIVEGVLQQPVLLIYILENIQETNHSNVRLKDVIKRTQLQPT